MTLKRFIPLLFLAACSNELRVYTDHDRSIDLPRLTNYDWLPERQIEARNNPIYFNELTDKRIKSAVEKQMSDKGYRHSTTGAQLLIHYHIIIENRVSVRPEPFGYNYGQYWLHNDVDTYRYNEGTLIIDIMDSKNCDLVWRGWAVSILDDERLITEELVDRAVTEMFTQFPLSAAKEATLP